MKTQRFLLQIPEYLKPFIVSQDYTLYTPIDHATWRFILKVSKKFFTKYAHEKYLNGLAETGISVERIPLIEEMNECLKEFGWQAVAVSGFIPPAAFMEFLSLGVLPIACDMRTLEHLAYTPAPDIVHEAAGHAPIIADPEYASYLRNYGEISQKAIVSSQDMNVYHAIRSLSETMEDPHSSQQEIEDAKIRLETATTAVTYVSESTQLSRMGWWTFEYGMIGSLSYPKIYGAGLLSSLGESYHCFDPQVEKVPFSIRCIDVTYDITRAQPQLFVAPDFQSLKDALEELAELMAFRRGGMEGLEKAKMAQTTTTTVLDSGVQISGILTDIMQTSSGRPYYLRFQGPTQISYQDRELEGQGADYHREGFGSPLEPITESYLDQVGMSLGNRGRLEFDSGVQVEGKLVDLIKRDGQVILLTFEECSVKKGSDFLFRPEWGKYDMVCGEKVTSVFGGAADRKRYLETTDEYKQQPGRQKSNLTDANRQLNVLYSRVRNLRGSAQLNSSLISEFTEIFQELESNYPNDWLLRYELLELSMNDALHFPWERQLRERLNEVVNQSPEMQETIRRGLELLDPVNSNSKADVV